MKERSGGILIIFCLATTLCSGIYLLLSSNKAVVDKIKKEDAAHVQKMHDNGLIKVTVVDSFTNQEGQSWTLLETEDQQRCYTYGYRGRAGDSFYVHYSYLEDYHDLNNRIPDEALK